MKSPTMRGSFWAIWKPASAPEHRPAMRKRSGAKGVAASNAMASSMAARVWSSCERRLLVKPLSPRPGRSKRMAVSPWAAAVRASSTLSLWGPTRGSMPALSRMRPGWLPGRAGLSAGWVMVPIRRASGPKQRVSSR